MNEFAFGFSNSVAFGFAQATEKSFGFIPTTERSRSSRKRNSSISRQLSVTEVGAKGILLFQDN
jgi:hypothetical protein